MNFGVKGELASEEIELANFLSFFWKVLGIVSKTCGFLMISGGIEFN